MNIKKYMNNFKVIQLQYIKITNNIIFKLNLLLIITFNIIRSF